MDQQELNVRRKNDVRMTSWAIALVCGILIILASSTIFLWVDNRVREQDRRIFEIIEYARDYRFGSRELLEVEEFVMRSRYEFNEMSDRISTLQELVTIQGKKIEEQEKTIKNLKTIIDEWEGKLP